ncbi:uncharacterized protein LOC135712785 [Ochlerotatus camptorhynchus]|uniref:uncharacterized protein LOC135712785 n=1 Tax=Ochlerotatus camptorhynchus TaxID=644619 RepID=UPI0031E21643
MVNRRLKQHLEAGNFLDHRQHAFRQGFGTTTYFATLGEVLKNAYDSGLYTEIVSLDISKAFNRTWTPLVLKQLIDWGLNGPIVHFIQNFLSNRSFRVAVGNTKSRLFPEGVPQGSVIAVILFLVAMNGVCRQLPKNICVHLRRRHPQRNHRTHASTYKDESPSDSLRYRQTDGSRSRAGVGIGLAGNITPTSWNLPPQCSVFSAEAAAIFIDATTLSDGPILVLSDSHSVIQALTSEAPTNPRVQVTMKSAPPNTVFCWVPGHCGIPGYSEADFLAGAGPSPLTIPTKYRYTMSRAGS